MKPMFFVLHSKGDLNYLPVNEPITAQQCVHVCDMNQTSLTSISACVCECVFTHLVQTLRGPEETDLTRHIITGGERDDDDGGGGGGGCHSDQPKMTG